MDEEKFTQLVFKSIRKLSLSRVNPTFSKIRLLLNRDGYHFEDYEIKEVLDRAVAEGKIRLGSGKLRKFNSEIFYSYHIVPKIYEPGSAPARRRKKRQDLRLSLQIDNLQFKINGIDTESNAHSLRPRLVEQPQPQTTSPVENDMDISPAPTGRIFVTKFELIRAIQDLLVENNNGLTLQEIFKNLSGQNENPEIHCTSTLKQQVSIMVFELVVSGIVVQEQNLFRIDQHRKEISEKLICAECNSPGTLIDLSKPFVFCWGCGIGYHFKCAFKTEINPIFVIGTGYLCHKCKMCQICYSHTQEPIESCAECSKGFHKFCRNKSSKSVFNDNLCNNCNLRSSMGQPEPEIVKPRKRRMRMTRSPPVEKIKKVIGQARRGRKSKYHLDIMASQKQTEPIDLLENLLSTHQFPDVTDEDIQIFKSIKEITTNNIPTVSINDPKICTPPYIQFGKYEIKSWYSSPFPQEYATVKKLHVCEFCLEYRKTAEIMSRHLSVCTAKNPPDREIYRSDDLSVYEVDGQNYKTYCQNLCLIAKLYLGHKTLHYDVEPFLFYILTKNDSHGRHLVGYFSKEKFSPQKYNVSCVTTLPPYQRIGYGRFLIDFSYLLTREEGVTGSPEKPLSALGQISYQAYWNTAICEYLNSKSPGDKITFRGIMDNTGMDSSDVNQTLRRLNMIKIDKDKKCFIVLRKNVIEKILSSRSYVYRINLNPLRLIWSPFIKVSAAVETPTDPSAPPIIN